MDSLYNMNFLCRQEEVPPMLRWVAVLSTTWLRVTARVGLLVKLDEDKYMSTYLRAW